MLIVQNEEFGDVWRFTPLEHEVLGLALIMPSEIVLSHFKSLELYIVHFCLNRLWTQVLAC